MISQLFPRHARQQGMADVQVDILTVFIGDE